jgi:serine protease AprX
MNKLIVVFAGLLAVMLLPLNAQHRYWVSFKNKNGTPYSIDKPYGFLSAKAVERRTRYNIRLDETDLPVTPAYVNQVVAINYARVLHVSKWLNGVLVTIDDLSHEAEVLSKINALPFVNTFNRTMRLMLLPPESEMVTVPESQRTSAGSGNYERPAYGRSYGQNHQLNVDCLHDQGYRGQGITVAVMDVGFGNVDQGPLFDSLRNSGRLLGTRDFVDGGTNAFQGGNHGTNVLSTMAAIKRGFVMGTAPLANYWLLRTEDGSKETITEEYNWVRAAEFADSVGADIFTTSLGYTTFDGGLNNHDYNSLNGRTAPMSIAATMAARKGIFVLTAAGNEGADQWHYIAVSGDADSVCTVGAVDTLGQYAFFSSVGPTSDGRIKPDLVACGWVSYICDGDNCGYGNGTSFATPILAGAVACYWQAYRHMNNIELLRSLKQYATKAASPDNQRGWGVPNVCKPVDDNFDVSAQTKDGVLNVRLAIMNYSYINIQLTDLMGKIVESTTVPNIERNFRINMATLCEGIYVLRVETSQGSRAIKVIRD